MMDYHKRIKELQRQKRFYDFVSVTMIVCLAILTLYLILSGVAK